ncbi:MAG TPA: hypothetical protein VGJ20_09885 [Xanthobacteraceae bacterium]|jgi:hypothetical protein
MKVSGRCYCGQISFEAEIQPDKIRVPPETKASRQTLEVRPAQQRHRPEFDKLVQTLLAEWYEWLAKLRASCVTSHAAQSRR